MAFNKMKRIGLMSIVEISDG